MATYTGTGSRTFVQALAKVCCRLAVYIAKHGNKIEANVDGPTWTCIQSIATCAASVCKYKNQSAP